MMKLVDPFAATPATFNVPVDACNLVDMYIVGGGEEGHVIVHLDRFPSDDRDPLPRISFQSGRLDVCS